MSASAYDHRDQCRGSDKLSDVVAWIQREGYRAVSSSATAPEQQEDSGGVGSPGSSSQQGGRQASPAGFGWASGCGILAGLCSRFESRGVSQQVSEVRPHSQCASRMSLGLVLYSR